MGKRFRVNGFRYGELHVMNEKLTNSLIGAIIWFIVFIIKYDGANLYYRRP